MNELSKWDLRFLEEAEGIKSWSKDKTTKVGCVIVNDRKRTVSKGYNGFPNNINDDIDERHERPLKYLFTEHAERNAIYNACDIGIPLRGTTLYLSGELCVCADCARAIIQVGIKEVIIPKPNKELYPQWYDSNMISVEMMTEAGIKVRYSN